MFCNSAFWTGIGLGSIFLVFVYIAGYLFQKGSRSRKTTETKLNNLVDAAEQIGKQAHREALESRLGTLVSLWNIEQRLRELKEVTRDKWQRAEEDPDDEEAFGWVPAYCRREVRKIGQQMRELDKKANGR